MIKNYFRIAWRNIVKHRFYSLLNIGGLSVGILFSFLIGAYVWNELQVNENLRNAKRQYFLESEWKDPNQGQRITTLAPLAKRLKEDYPGLVANYYRWDGITSVVSKGEKHLREGIQLGDSTLLSMYGFELLHGDAHTALNDAYSVVITKEMAIKYFGRTDVVGETIGIQSFSGTNHDFLVTGVLKELPENSVSALNDNNHNNFFIPLAATAYFNRNGFEDWNNLYIPSYIELHEGVTAGDLEQPIRQLIQQNAREDIKQNLAVAPVALSSYHLQKDNGLAKRMIYTLSFTGLFILLMAVINFVNVSVGSSTARIKEIGIRKVLGSLRKQIIFQFIAESVILVMLATVVAIGGYPFLRPLFGDIVGKELPVLSAFPAWFIILPLLMVMLIAVLAGLYPAIKLSAIKATDSVKGKLSAVHEHVWLRKSLAGFQFAMAAIVMIAAFIVSQQVSYFFGRQLGYNKEYVVSSQVPRNWSREGVRKMEAIRTEFAAMPQVSAVTLSYEIPNGNNGGQPPVYKNGTDSTAAIPMQLLITDENYAGTYQVPVNAGSFFSNTDSGQVVINEQAAAALGWKDPKEAIGQQLRVPADPTVFNIKGVTANFHFGSMQEKIAPVIFMNVNILPTYRYLSFRLKPGNTGDAIAAIEKKWAQLLPGSSFEYNFMDDTLKGLYKKEIQLRKAAYTSTALALVMVLMGLLGILSLSIRKRTKEIGIRKVLGSSTGAIIFLFMKEFLWVMLVAACIACPVAWIIMHGWLSDYAYRITLTPVPFIASITALAMVTGLVIVLQTLKAGTANPVKSLQSE